MRLDKDLEQDTLAQERDNHDTCKRSRELNLGLRSSKAWIKVFIEQHSRASNHVYRLRPIRENLIGNDNHKIIKTWILF